MLNQNCVGKDQADNDKGDDDSDEGHAVATNSGTASNDSDGTAEVTSGDATAIGTTSNTEVTQEAEGDDVDQDVEVSNEGEAFANTGGNTAVGNASDNQAPNDQSASS